jgi:hypothetical protein
VRCVGGKRGFGKHSVQQLRAELLCKACTYYWKAPLIIFAPMLTAVSELFWDLPTRSSGIQRAALHALRSRGGGGGGGGGCCEIEVKVRHRSARDRISHPLQRKQNRKRVQRVCYLPLSPASPTNSQNGCPRLSVSVVRAPLIHQDRSLKTLPKRNGKSCPRATSAALLQSEVLGTGQVFSTLYAAKCPLPSPPVHCIKITTNKVHCFSEFSIQAPSP